MFGHVRNIITGKILTLFPNEKGYLRVCLQSNDGKHKTPKIHRMVVTVYLPNPSGRSEVNHKDGDKQNNFVWNLEWSTRRENMIHAFKNNLINVQSRSGENHYRTNLTVEIVEEICKALLFHGMVNVPTIVWELNARGIDVTKHQVNHIKYKNVWREVSDRWF
jgi:hypothetical protein